eukprot:CAMPEP_0118665638 /NCGR_PEP_ID=MMETSP0785-20121206/18732_1 /TAXON_ID=91992 /ORGANISM="Bolidomonas pacifica, Strain CCMP 1866" /LENGTH=169 /DNA_ID=CAMNT_0006559783 /DNA_START=107 /DNA_END=612 /DNA_ORIENTATION=-
MASFAASFAASNPSFTPSFNQYATEIRSLCSRAHTLSSSDFQSQTSELLNVMKIEARSCDDRKAAMKEYESIRNEVDRAALLGSSSSSSNASSSNSASNGNAAAKKRFLETNDKIEKQNATLERIQQSVAEIEDVGGEITTQLQSNREQIKKQQDRVKEVNTMSKYADS